MSESDGSCDSVELPAQDHVTEQVMSLTCELLDVSDTSLSPRDVRTDSCLGGDAEGSRPDEDSLDATNVINLIERLKSSSPFASISDPTGVPRVRVIEEPQSRGFRFRYRCEGPAHGGLQGANSEKTRKTFPSVEICHYRGPARIVVNLMTDDHPPTPHVHELVGKSCNNGVCIVELKGDNMTATFPSLGVQHVTKKDLMHVLTQRIMEQMRTKKMQRREAIHLTTEETAQAEKQAKKQAKKIKLNVVRLCFTAYLMDNHGHFSHILPPVFSSNIFDSKSPSANVLKICRLDRTSGKCTGGDEVFLLCEKVQKDDIAVKFVQQDAEGVEQWRAYGNFSPADVHRQYAIVFKTPAYRDTDIEGPVEVQLMLQRRSDNECSDPKTFYYKPAPTDLEEIGRKRKKALPNFGQIFSPNPLL